MTVLITGINGFLGQHVKEEMNRQGVPFKAYSSEEYNLLSEFETRGLIDDIYPDVILHMAAVCGGIKANKKRPADFVQMNARMACNIFEFAKEFAVNYVYTLGSVCSYPKFCPSPFVEEDIWNGYPEETNAPYGTAKRLQMVMQQAYYDQYNIMGAHLVPVNMYGEHDHFDLENSHVIPALINKFVTAKENGENQVEIWGSGNATREFLYAGDCAKAIVKAIRMSLHHPGPINIGTGKDISIRELAEMIGQLVGFEGELKYLGNDIDGQPKRMLDVTRAREVLGFEAETDLKTGLKKTIDWYLREKHG